ncbi:MAG TPA: hypothetical protein VEV43_04355 [Actinomycetota bacterium]|nr:hypothetical protein [Actinomycetota bacterium]
MRRPLVAGLAACLLLGAAVAPATAKKKKPRKPPVTFEATGALALGHPGDVAAGANVTRTAFLETCAIPPSQGTDGYVIELPPAVTAVPTNVTITGVSAGDLHDLDVHFFGDGCSSLGGLATEQVGEFGLMPAGTKYVLVTAFMGVQTDFVFKAEGV